ncbi:MAG: hypothetical protein U9O95_05935 [Candidatus Marinimicrobia bacterium]|nr:hypothetical protein [Candidatus Neomarinimicrobiota bacterium]
MSYVLHPACFPDTLCLASVWSPVYKGFGIQEGMIYGGSRGFDLSLKTQYHPLMSNHMLTFGFPILKEEQIRAGLQFHYTLSSLHGIDIRHKGSCSGGLLLYPHPDWVISFYSMHLLSFPRDSTEHLLEAATGTMISYSIIPGLQISMAFQKRVLLSWQMLFSVSYRPWEVLAGSVRYGVTEHELEVELSIDPGRWQMQVILNYHRYLGMTQKIVIAYAY